MSRSAAKKKVGRQLDEDTVELPVCLECGRIGLQPYSTGPMQYSCTGPSDNQHKRAKMVPQRFRRDDEEDEDGRQEED